MDALRPIILDKTDMDESDRAESAGEGGERSGNGIFAMSILQKLKSVNSGLTDLDTGGKTSLTKSFYTISSHHYPREKKLTKSI